MKHHEQMVKSAAQPSPAHQSLLNLIIQIDLVIDMHCNHSRCAQAQLGDCVNVVRKHDAANMLRIINQRFML